MVVTGWLNADSEPLGTPLSRQVSHVETFTNEFGYPLYFVVYLDPSGFVIVPSDDRIEPILGFASNGSYAPSSANPLAALVTNDVNCRLLIAVKSDPGEAIDTNGDDLAIAATDVQESKTQKKWRRFIGLAAATPGELSIASVSAEEIDDLRIAPLLKTRWDQQTCHAEQYDVDGNPYMVDTRSACYNFYTPPSDTGDPCDYLVPSTYSGVPGTYGDPNNYPCGCVATAMAQLMRYYQWPQEGIGKNEFDIQVKYGEQWQSEKAWTRGGDGLGGPYDWVNMLAMPDCGDLNHSKAIGALCYDAGVSVGMKYAPDASGPADALQLSTALVRTFKYKNAIVGVNVQNNELVNIGATLTEMINPNLDARKPVILGIKGFQDEKEVRHAVVCDGYGFNASAAYYHLNMGESKLPAKCSAVWYQLIPPDITHTCTWSACADDPNCQCPECMYPYEADWSYDTIQACVYNIFPENTGEIISGRVFNTNGEPMSDIPVHAESDDGTDTHDDTTDANGIFAFVGCKPGTEYTVSVIGDYGQFPSPKINTGVSSDYLPKSGNVWGVYIRENHPPGPFLYVDANAPKDANVPQNGSLECPYDTVQEAIDATLPGDTVILLPGTYKGDGNRDIDFKGKAITVRSTEPNDPLTVESTVIDCEGTPEEPHRAFLFLSGEKASSVLAGLTLTNGYTNASGGAIFILASPTLKNLTLTMNYADWGGAICCSGRPTLVNLRLIMNSSPGAGGAIGIFGNPLLKNCTFIENRSFCQGGAVDIQSSNPTFVKCTFISNITERSQGGAIANMSGDVTIISCVFTRNSALSASAIYTTGTYLEYIEDWGYIDPQTGKYIPNPMPIIIDIYGNTSIQNCTFTENFSEFISSSSIGAEFYCEANLSNCIVWGNGTRQLSGNITVSYSDIEGGWDGECNIDTDPLFADATNGDCHLKSQAGRWDTSSQGWVMDDVTSPCIDAGDPSGPIGDEPSPNGGRINMGAYGGTAEASKSLSN